MLKDGEVVHHIDCNRLNNSEGNLIVFDSHSSHAAFHASGETSAIIQNDDGTYRCDGKCSERCEVCGESAVEGRHICFKCLIAARRAATIPPLSDLIEDIKAMSYVKVGKKYGVSDNAVRKWFRSYGLSDDVQKLIKHSCKS